ncbi:MAG: inositol monophosphatase [Solirubrobacteraceae bacterium]|nr:inositol monophosphatase [Solirubrobacteraceae bacterium]
MSTGHPADAELLAVAEAAAGAAAAVLVEYAGRRGPGEVTAKSTPTDLVSEADVAAERAIRHVLLEHRPGDAVVGEEGADKAGETGLRWVVDPLDGTINYLFGLPQWCVSVACEGRVGVILDPLRGECFRAVAGTSAVLGDEPLAPSACDDLGRALVATGFGYDADVRRAQAAQVAELLPRVRDIRRFGSAALDLAWTAAGRYDAYYERGVQPWDVAAGLMLCAAAGLEQRPLPARDGLPDGVLVAPAGIVGELEVLLA